MKEEAKLARLAFLAGSSVAIIGIELIGQPASQPLGKLVGSLIKPYIDSEQQVDVSPAQQLPPQTAGLSQDLRFLSEVELEDRAAAALGYSGRYLPAEQPKNLSERFQKRADFWNEYLYISQGSRLKMDKSLIRLGDSVFKTDDPSDLIWASALIETEIRRTFLQDSLYKFDRPLSGAFTDILALRGKVKFINPDQGNYLDARRLAQLSRSLRVFEGADKKIPKEVFITDGRGKDPGVPLADDVLKFSGTSPYELALYYLKNDPTLMQAYEQRVTEINRQVGSKVTEPWMTRVNFTNHELSIRDDLLESFRKYIEDGETFRSRILYAKTNGFESEAAILQAKYDALHSWLDQEFSINAMFKRVRELQVDDIVLVDDYEAHDYGNWGIYLRPDAVLDIDPSWPHVETGYKVKIISGPVIISNEARAEATAMYKVIAGNVSSFNGYEIFIPYSNEGWLPGRFLVGLNQGYGPG